MDLECLSVGLLVADHLCAPIDHFPAAGELILTERLVLTTGGCASNAAMDLARLSVKVGVVGCVGRDAFGRFVVESLQAGGVATEDVRELDEIGTSGTLIVNVRGEDRRFIHTMGANARLSADDIPRDKLRAAKVLYVGGYLLMPALEQKQLAELFREARAAGVRTVLDVVLPGPGDHMAQLEALLPETDVFLPNDDEAAAITGLAEPEAQAERFHAAGAGTVVITRGGEGAVLVTDGLKLRAPTFPTKFVGGTGSGDAFDAGYIAGLIDGGDAEHCLRWASALGASCVRSVGATESVFTRDEAEQFLKEHPLEFTRW